MNASARLPLVLLLAALGGLPEVLHADGEPTLRWRRDLDVPDGVAEQRTVASRVLLDGSWMVVTDGEGGLHATRVDRATGALLSRVRVTAGLAATAVAVDPFGRVAVAGGGSGSEAAVALHDGRTGRPLWPAPVPLAVPPAQGWPALSGLAFDSRGQLAVAGTVRRDGRGEVVTAMLDAAKGAVVWGPLSWTDGDASGVYGLEVDAAGELVLLSGTVGPGGWAVTRRLRASDGASLWWATLPGLSGPAALRLARGRDPIVVVRIGGAAEGLRVVAYDGASGAVRWGPVDELLRRSYTHDFLSLAVDGGGAAYIAASAPGPGGDRVAVVKVAADGRRAWRTTYRSGTSGGSEAVYGLGLGRGDRDLVLLTGWLSHSGHAESSLVGLEASAGRFRWRTVTCEGAGRGVLAIDPEERALAASLSFPGANVATVAAVRVADGAALWPAVGWSGGGRRGAAVMLAADGLGRVDVVSYGYRPILDTIANQLDESSGRTTWGPVVVGGPYPDWASGGVVGTGGDLVVLSGAELQSDPSIYRVSLQGIRGSDGATAWGPVLWAPPGDTVTGIWALCRVGDGDVVIAGRSSVTASGPGRTFVIRFRRSDGAVVWGPVFLAPGVPGEELFPRAIQSDGAGDLLLTGSLVPGASGGDSAIATYKLRGGTGEIAWGPVTFAGTGPGDARSAGLCVDSAGDVVVLGVKTDAVTLQDLVTLKYAGATGALVWGPIRYDGPDHRADVPRALALHPSGDVVVAGTSRDAGGSRHLIVLRYAAADGHVIWAATPVFASGREEETGDLAVDADGTVFVAAKGWAWPSPEAGLGTGLLLGLDGETGAVSWAPYLFSNEFALRLIARGGDPIVATDTGPGVTILRLTKKLVIDPQASPGPASCAEPYSFTAAARNGTAPLSWGVVAGALPGGVSISSGGVVQGVPAAEGTFPFRLRVSDATGATSEREVEIVVGPSSTGVAILADRASTCPGAAVTLSVPGTFATYLWQPGGETTPAVVVRPDRPADFGVVVSNGGCESRGSVRVDVERPGGASMVAPDYVVAGSAGHRAEVWGDEGGEYFWSIVNGAITAGQGTGRVEFAADAPGWLALSAEPVGGACPAPTSGRLVAVGGPSSFHTLEPCRVVDTRNLFLGAPALDGLSVRRLEVAPGPCGIPGTARALSVNVTVTGPESDGNLRLFPADEALPATSTINFRSGQTRAAAAIVRLSSDGFANLAVRNDSPARVHLILDVNGYFE